MVILAGNFKQFKDRNQINMEKEAVGLMGVIIILVFVAGCTSQTETQETDIETPSSPAGDIAAEQETDKQAAEEMPAETAQEPEQKKVSKPVSANPVDVLSDELVKKLGADCRSKTTDIEKASCLLDWQEKNIFWCYTHPEETAMPKMFEAGYPDCVADMQFQQMVPGSFPVSKAIELKIRNKKVFGACYTYATTYCALARWNGLKCRVMEVKIITPMDYSASGADFGAGYCGAAQKSYLDALGQDCDRWKALNWIIYYDHYWAEVQIDGKWQIMERPTWAYMRDTQKNIIDAGREYKDTGW